MGLREIRMKKKHEEKNFYHAHAAVRRDGTIGLLDLVSGRFVESL